MITLRRGQDRPSGRNRRRREWFTFDAEDAANPLPRGYGALELLNETRLAPGAALPRDSCHDVEILTYVHEGALAFEDSLGNSGVVRAGEFQCVTAGHRLRHGQSNASRTDWVQFFELRLRSSEADLDPGREQKRFSVAQRHNSLCIVASFDTRKGSLLVHQDALVYSAVLDPGQHIAYELAQGRSAWLHVGEGKVAVGEVVLTTGDGAGIAGERAVSLTALEAAEILLIDLSTPSD